MLKRTFADAAGALDRAFSTCTWQRFRNLGLTVLIGCTSMNVAAVSPGGAMSYRPSMVTRHLVQLSSNGQPGVDHQLVGLVFHGSDEVAEVQLEKRVPNPAGSGKIWTYVRTVDVVDYSYSVKFSPDSGVNRYRIKAVVRPKPNYFDPAVETGLPPLVDVAGPQVLLSRPISVRIRPTGGSRVQATADTPVTRWVVALGDSYMSGEGASFAQFNTTSTSWWSVNPDWWIEAYGASLQETYPDDYSYPDNTPLFGVRCHRSASAGMHWGRAGYQGMNLACSGATQPTQAAEGKPGVDFYDQDNLQGQATQLQRFAKKVSDQGETIDTILLSIGGNDIQFANIIADCTKKALLPGKSCANDPNSVLRRQVSNNLQPLYDAVVTSLKNIVQAMDAAGQPRNTYRIQVQGYPIGVPPSADLPGYLNGALETISDRQKFGGCPFANSDLDYINGTFAALARDRVIEATRAVLQASLAEGNGIRIAVADVGDVFANHQLCSESVPVPDNTSKFSGINTLSPPWTGFAGGSLGQWVTPIMLNCMVGGLPCLSTADLPWYAYPNLWTAVNSPSGCPDYSGGVWNGQGLEGACAEALANMQQMPMHPNYWGQRQLAACHDMIASQPDAPGQVLGCHATSGLDDYGRPNIRLSQNGYL